jgi:hypothetical protein
MPSLIGHWEIKTKPGRGYNKAMHDSYGFFNRIAGDDWDKMKQESMKIIGMQVAITEKSSQVLSESGANIDSNLWWNDNWKASFSYLSVYLSLLGYFAYEIHRSTSRVHT